MPTTIGSKFTTKTFETKYLTKNFFTFDIDCSQSLKYHSAKSILGALEILIIFPVLLGCSIPLAGFLQTLISRSKRTRHSHIDHQRLAFRPKWNHHISRATTSGVAKNTFLFHHRGQQCVGANAIDEITNRVVANNNISFLCAASGMVTKYINRLLAQRTGDFFIHDRNSEAVSDGGLKDSRAQQSFFAVFITWNCSDESTSVWRSCTPQALCSASVRLVNQI